MSRGATQDEIDHRGFVDHRMVSGCRTWMVTPPGRASASRRLSVSLVSVPRLAGLPTDVDKARGQQQRASAVDHSMSFESGSDIGRPSDVGDDAPR
jgi:hypothetical protein